MMFTKSMGSTFCLFANTCDIDAIRRIIKTTEKAMHWDPFIFHGTSPQCTGFLYPTSTHADLGYPQIPRTGNSVRQQVQKHGHLTWPVASLYNMSTRNEFNSG